MEQSATTGGENLFLQPERIITYFGLAKGDFVADFGAGHGFFAIPMARIVGNDGKIFAIDIQKSIFDVIKTKAGVENLHNIEYVWANIDAPHGTRLKSDYINFVLVANTLFQSEQKAEVLREAYRVLHKNGRVAIIEWDQSASLIGPAPEHRIKKETVKQIATEIGFVLDREFEAGSHHYGLLFIKK